VNGRVAMLAFAAAAAAESSTHVSVADQFGAAWPGVLIIMALIMLGSLLPKFVTGYSLKELHESATTANMQGEGVQAALALFDTNLELWTGRIAMLGFTGLLANELFVKGGAFF
jgi:hypothetical protein